MRNFRRLHVWTDSIQLVDKVYECTKSFPDSQKWGITNQMQRCAVSIPSNIAEGCSRSSDKEFSRFIKISLGSSFELETQLIIALNRNFLPLSEFEIILSDLHSFQRRLNSLNNTLKK